MGCSKTMTVENIKALLDACYQAKRARELLPELPKGSARLISAISIPSRAWRGRVSG